ncbi:MAG: formyltransferase, partial [Betaproteobacteria bacterium]|nr:formyltransferase [Betaproteobacteria bacterium]
MTRAVVFAYHTIGVRCLEVLLEHGIEIALVVTHRDNPQENIWFDSVAALAQARGLPCIMPEDPNDPAVVAKVRALRPDFLFSFYYRHMLGAELLALPARGAYNLHGSLLPRYRGRVPVNWAVIHGETETGATLHLMTEKPDNGDIIAQTAVPILPDDTALEVFRKVTCAAEITLHGVLPDLISGRAKRLKQDLSL